MEKFTMELVWHNCATHPPKEKWIRHLCATDGEFVFKVEYDKYRGWYDYRTFEYITADMLHRYWWADIVQTVNGYKKFKEN